MTLVNVCLRTNGERVSIVPGLSMARVEKLIGAVIDAVNLRDGRVMLIDDLGHAKDLPINRLKSMDAEPDTPIQ